MLENQPEGYPFLLRKKEGTDNTYYTTLTSLSTIGVGVEGKTPCFHEDVEILCYNPETKLEEYKKIKYIQKNIDYVKSIGTKNEYTKVKSINILYSSNTTNDMDRKVNGYPVNKIKQFYQHKIHKDIIITGGHSILKEELTLNENEKMNNFVLESKWKAKLNIDKYNKLLTCFSDDFELYKHNKDINKIYTIILDEENKEDSYGLYLKHEIIAESCSEKHTLFNLQRHMVKILNCNL